MSVQQCEECRLALVRVVFDPEGSESDGWGCQLDEGFSDQTREVDCPFFVGWAQALPPPARSCKKSQGKIDGCSAKSEGSCGSCGTSGGCGSGGCGMGDPAGSLDVKWDPEDASDGYAADGVAQEHLAAARDRMDHAHAHERGDDHDHDHDEDPPGREQHGEGPSAGDTRHRPGHAALEPHPVEPAQAPAPSDEAHPLVPDGHAPDSPDDGYPTEPAASCATACGALKALDRMGLGRDEDAPVPIPLED